MDNLKEFKKASDINPLEVISENARLYNNDKSFYECYLDGVDEYKSASDKLNKFSKSRASTIPIISEFIFDKLRVDEIAGSVHFHDMEEQRFFNNLDAQKFAKNHTDDLEKIATKDMEKDIISTDNTIDLQYWSLNYKK